ncbi:hypothetical protein MAM1_0231d08437 [Mucor ambiguus]|uniref:Uncharacterized protein n=1 Tax=Mucor ambiguus TaxID=91626 RepID=A0A0C9MZ87_9FUNG|nr:hypothetical protein MAM1_0231d08437 [Mucor ambiguus]
MCYCAHLLQLSIAIVGFQVLSTAAIHLLSLCCIILALAVTVAADAHLLSCCCFLLVSPRYLSAAAASFLVLATADFVAHLLSSCCSHFRSYWCCLPVTSAIYLLSWYYFSFDHWCYLLAAAPIYYLLLSSYYSIILVLVTTVADPHLLSSCASS